MVQRNLTVPHQFICFTEDSSGIDPNVNVIPLKEQTGVEGWWYKPSLFDPHNGLSGTVLYLDLDVVVFRNIDHLFEYNQGKFCIIRDFIRHQVKGWQKVNSSCFRFEVGKNADIYTAFAKGKRIGFGDQDLIYHIIKDQDFEYWPDEWIQSYKWEMRGKPQMDRKPKGERDFVTPGDPKINPQTAIAVFHGDPNPHNCKDQWVIDNWR